MIVLLLSAAPRGDCQGHGSACGPCAGLGGACHRALQRIRASTPSCCLLSTCAHSKEFQQYHWIGWQRRIGLCAAGNFRLRSSQGAVYSIKFTSKYYRAVCSLAHIYPQESLSRWAFAKNCGLVAFGVCGGAAGLFSAIKQMA